MLLIGLQTETFSFIVWSGIHHPYCNYESDGRPLVKVQTEEMWKRLLCKTS